MFQGRKVTKVKAPYDLRMTLTAKFVEHSHVVAHFQALGFWIPNLKELF